MSAENKTVAVRAAASVTLPAVSMRGIVIFPSLLMHFDVGREKSILAIKKAMEDDDREKLERLFQLSTKRRALFDKKQ